MAMNGEFEKDWKPILSNLLYLIAKRLYLALIIIAVIIVIIILRSFSKNRVLTIYNGPYSIYTPVSLQAKKQKEINEKFPLSKYLFCNGELVKIEMTKDQNLTYSEGWWQSIETKDNNQLKKIVLFTNSYFWLLQNKGCVSDTVWLSSRQGDAYRLEVIGYKKTEKPYYTSRFIWHKSMPFPCLKQKVKHQSFLLNSKDESGSTHIIPEIYLLEKCNTELPDISWDTRQNIIQECVFKKQIIGIMSHSEYSEQLDKAMKDSLSIKDIMVNIPMDVVTMVTGHIPKDRIDKLDGLDNLSNMSDSILKDKYKAHLWTNTDFAKQILQAKNLIITQAKDSLEYKKSACLREMLTYYVSMGIIRYDKKNKLSIIIPQDSDWLNIRSIKEADSVMIYKTRYGNLEDHYYSFDFIGKIAMENLSHKNCHQGHRIIPCGSSANELENLINKRDSLFKPQRYDSN